MSAGMDRRPLLLRGPRASRPTAEATAPASTANFRKLRRVVARFTATWLSSVMAMAYLAFIIQRRALHSALLAGDLSFP